MACRSWRCFQRPPTAPAAGARAPGAASEHRHPALLAARHGGRGPAGDVRHARGLRLSEVELFQLHGRSAADLRALLDARGLFAIGAHVSIDRWRSQRETVLDEAEALGMPYVGVPGIFPPPPPEVSEWRDLAEELNEHGEAAAERGLRFDYHNHDFEFPARRRPGALRPAARPHRPGPRVLRARSSTGSSPPGATRSTTSTGTTSRAGRSSTSRTGRPHPPRPRPAGISADLGEGIINFPRIFRELQNKQYHHFIVERDTQANPRRTARVGYQYLADVEGRRRRRPHAAARGARRGRRVRVPRRRS